MTKTALIIGQSPGVRWKTDGTDLTASNTTLWNGSAFVTPGTTGNGQISFGNTLAAALSETIQQVNGASNTTALLSKAKTGGNGFWLDETVGEPYDLAKAQVIAAAVSEGVATDKLLDIIIWMQGERDATSAVVNENEYTEGLRTLFERLRSDFGSIPIVVMGLGRNTSDTNDADWEGIRTAQYNVQGETTLVSATPLDLALVDNVHLTPAGYTTHGLRAALVAEQLLVTADIVYQGPRITSVTSPASTATTVIITHDGGSDFTPTTGITGFEVSDDNFLTTATISSAVQIDTDQILLNHSTLSTSSRRVRYLYGASPTVASAVIDDNADPLPLEWVDNTKSKVENVAFEIGLNITDVGVSALTDFGMGSGKARSGGVNVARRFLVEGPLAEVTTINVHARSQGATRTIWAGVYELTNNTDTGIPTGIYLFQEQFDFTSATFSTISITLASPVALTQGKAYAVAIIGGSASQPDVANNFVNTSFIGLRSDGDGLTGPDFLPNPWAADGGDPDDNVDIVVWATGTGGIVNPQTPNFLTGPLFI